MYLCLPQFNKRAQNEKVAPRVECCVFNKGASERGLRYRTFSKLLSKCRGQLIWHAGILRRRGDRFYSGEEDAARARGSRCR